VSLRPVMPIPLATKLSIFEARKEYASNWHPSIPVLATRSGAAPRIGIHPSRRWQHARGLRLALASIRPDVSNTLGGFASNRHLFAQHWQHARGLRLALASIRPVLATLLGASSCIGIYSPSVGNTLGGLRLALASIRPALITRSGASPRIGIYSRGVSNVLRGYTLRC
jgi:hypothetical protein